MVPIPITRMGFETHYNHYPAVMLWAITFPLYFELEPPADLTVQDFFYQVLFFTVNDFRWRRNCWVAAGYQVGWRRSEFDNIEHGVEAPQAAEAGTHCERLVFR